MSGAFHPLTEIENESWLTWHNTRLSYHHHHHRDSGEVVRRVDGKVDDYYDDDDGAAIELILMNEWIGLQLLWLLSVAWEAYYDYIIH